MKYSQSETVLMTPPHVCLHDDTTEIHKNIKKMKHAKIRASPHTMSMTPKRQVTTNTPKYMQQDTCKSQSDITQYSGPGVSTT